MSFKEWLEALEFPAGFRGASRAGGTGWDKASSSQYSSPFGPTDKQMRASHEGDYWKAIDQRLHHDDCDGAETMFNKFKDDLPHQKAKQADTGWEKRYTHSFCPIKKHIDKGDCDKAFKAFDDRETLLKGQGKDGEAGKLADKFLTAYDASSCALSY